MSDGEQGKTFDLHRPVGAAKDEYLSQWRDVYSTVFDLIKNNQNRQFNKDLVLACRFAIPLIAHDNIRRKQELFFEFAIEFTLSRRNMRLEDGKIISLSVEEKNDQVLQICAITLGNLTAYVDQYRGLAHTLKIGELVNMEKSYAQRDHAFESTIVDLGE
jgi:hypothetical protein